MSETIEDAKKDLGEKIDGKLEEKKESQEDLQKRVDKVLGELNKILEENDMTLQVQQNIRVLPRA